MFQLSCSTCIASMCAAARQYGVVIIKLNRIRSLLIIVGLEHQPSNGTWVSIFSGEYMFFLSNAQAPMILFYV